jgi:hypothetical protein
MSDIGCATGNGGGGADNGGSSGGGGNGVVVGGQLFQLAPVDSGHSYILLIFAKSVALKSTALPITRVISGRRATNVCVHRK